jgi:extradiol dioxygenase family protein
MNVSLNRPIIASDIKGSLGFELFQHAYIVRDLETAMATFKEHYGIEKFTPVPMPPMEGPTSMRIGLAWSGGQMIELIEARGPGLEIYTEWSVPGQDIRLHHFGYLIENDGQWAALEQKLAAEGKPHVFFGSPSLCKFIYVFAKELGHYMEFVYPTAEGKAFFDSVAAY